jgi:hypothetical protein
MARLFKTGITADGDITTAGILKSTASSGSEGGQVDLAAAASGGTLTTGVSIDVYQNKLRFFETGGTNRGFYLDISGGGASVASNLGAAATGTTTNALTVGTVGLKMTTGTSPWNGSAAATIDVDNTKVALLSGATFTGNIAINNGTSTAITTTGTTANIFNTNATTVNIAGGATNQLNLGSISGGTTYLNSNVYSFGTIEAGSNVFTSSKVSGSPAANTSAGWHLNTSAGYATFGRDSGTCLFLQRLTTTTSSPIQTFYVNSTASGTINVASGGTPAFAAPSDYRAKENIVPVADAIERMKKAKAYTFNKIESVDPTKHLQRGFIAHELAEVEPFAVFGEKDAVDENGDPVYQTVTEAAIIPIMAQAMSDLIHKVEQLEARLATLEAK